MARKQHFGNLTHRNQDRIAREGARYGLTRRQSRERYNRGTFNPLSRKPERRIPARAPYYPVSAGPVLKGQAMRNMDAKLGDDFSYQSGRFGVLDAVEHHASDDALRRMANASEDELRTWAESQRRFSYKGKPTPEWLRSLGWTDSKGKWHNVFWYH